MVVQRRDGPRRLRDSDDDNDDDDDDDDDMVSILQQRVKRFHPLQNAYRDKAISLTVPVDFLSDSAPFTPVLPPGWSLRVYAFFVSRIPGRSYKHAVVHKTGSE